MKTVKALVITGYGINCEKEMALACRLAGATSTIEHAKKLLKQEIDLDAYDLLAFPGGFSFGDELGAGKAFANRLSYTSLNMKERLEQFIERGKAIIGICNGFQLLVKLGLLPGNGAKQTLSLAHNDSCQFEARWTHHRILPSPCIFTRKLEQLYLPVRHAEGKLIANNQSVITSLFNTNQVVMQYADSTGTPSTAYPLNPNGSADSIAGICDPTGRVFGLMPHPEAALYFTNQPNWLREKTTNKTSPIYGEGFHLFHNAINYLRGNG